MVYLDNNATTRMADEVLSAMMPFLTTVYGNASSTQHAPGRQASQAVAHARGQIAAALHTADPREWFFTSGATEAINTVLKGVALRYQGIGKHIITCQTEHKAVLETCGKLEKKGFTVSYLPVSPTGVLDPEVLRQAITPQTILVSIMLANNETGVLHPLQEIAQVCAERHVLLFCDATQYIGKEGFIDLQHIPVDMLCISAHKFHGPKGIGALYVRRKSKRIQLEPLLTGGNQEQALRGGTYNVPGIVGLGAAIELAQSQEVKHIAAHRKRLEGDLLSQLEGCRINGLEAPRLSNTSSVTIRHVRSAELISRLSDLAISSGSACVTGSRDPSHVLQAMGLSADDALSTIRISLSRYTTAAEIDHATHAIVTAVKQIRQHSPTWDMYKRGLID